MGSQVLTSSDRPRTYWTPPMERYFVDLMLDQVLKGNRIGHTFNKQAWTDMLTMFNAKFGSKYDKDVLKGRYKNMWEQYNDVKNLLEKGGFAWDETRQMVIAADHDWDAYLKAHPQVRCYKTKPILNYDDFCLIYGYTTADGRYSRSSHDADLDDEIPRMKSGVGKGTQKPNDSDRSRTNWTPDMDRCFVDLMLDQVHKGNKIEHTFNKKAWTEMILLFNEKFESKYSKNVLRSRYKILRKHYSDINVLLGQSGFDLDESRRMVIADDCTWDAYIKAHPDARSCRTTSVPDYNHLYMIYGNEIADGRKLRSVHKAGRGDDVSGVNIGERKEGLICLTDQTPTSFDRSRTYWTPPMDRYFIDLMLDQVCKGNKIENTFIAQAWIDMTALFNTRFLSHHDKEVLKNRYKSLRKQYTDINILLEQNGFTWDETRQMVRADDNIWDAYVKEHPDARSYRTRIVPNYKDLCLICGSTSAYRRCNRLDQNTNYDVRDISIGEMGNHDITSYDSSGTYWTPQMDRYFIDLMLEHLHMGNKIDAKETWTVIITLFNAEFGSQYGEDVLRHRYQDLWIQYNDIKSLLGQSGFSWDESQQMIIADDDVGDTFIQDHPDVQSYINKTVPYYSDLCMIFENASAGERSSCEDVVDLHYDVAKSTAGERMGCQVSTQCDGSSRTYWTPPMDRYFIDLMLEQVQKGNQIDNTFNREAWMEMITLFNVTFGSQHDRDFLKNRYRNLRRQFNYIKSLLGLNGFLWDETRQMVIADDDTWDSYLKEHPDALSYRTKKALDYNSLCVIYGNATANGEENHTREDAGPKIDGDIVTNKTEGKDSDSPTISDRSRTYWTPPMDRYFIGLMLDQVQKGNKVDHTFNKQAWGHMIACFNGKFGSHYDKDVLKSRYKNLRKQYNYIKILLDQSDFDWDENRQMVTADEDVWDSYIKEHPDAQSYRNKFLANYKDLCFIYGNGSADGRESHSGHELELDSQVMVMTTDTISGGLQSCATSVSHRDPVDDVKETIPHSDSQPQKRPSTTTLIRQKSGKLRKTEDNGMKDYPVGEMPVLVNQKKDNENSDPVGNMVSSLQALPDMDEDLILDACDLLEDERKAKTFLALDVKLRKKWLLRKLRPQNLA